jgi:heterodisulfide reductase subunit B
MRFAYYPGCTAASTAIEYDESVRETFQRLGVGLEEVPEWTCCGAGSGHAVSKELAVALPSRNLALSNQMSLALVSPCPACSLRHQVAEHELRKSPELRSRISGAIGMNLELPPKPRHILDVLHRDVGIAAIREKVKKPLEGLKVVAYYGCYLVRPPEITEFDDPENPTAMDRVMEALGAEVIDWSFKIDCCGGGLAIVAPEIVKNLSGKIAEAASELGADAIVTACSICQANLDMRQPKRSASPPLPIFYFSELSALALGSSSVNSWLAKHLVDPSDLLDRLRLL